MDEKNRTCAGLTEENGFGHQAVAVAGKRLLRSAVPAGFRIFKSV
jgi:hypothetical protein